MLHDPGKIKIMKSYRDLEVYKESKRLAIEIHRLSLSLPRFELYEEGSQVRRASKAVTSAIVEGYARRRYKADFIRVSCLRSVRMRRNNFAP